jgi:hypothetical protein
MLRWWREIGVDRADLAVKQRPPAGMILHHDLALGHLPLTWARGLNLCQAEVYIRPARGYAWPLVFLDDVPTPLARRVARKYDAMVVQTSPAGGCHIWLGCLQPLEEQARCKAQRWLARHLAADPGSVSGEHLGRLAGFKNWKRGGTWVNVLDDSRHRRLWDPTAVPSISRHDKIPADASRQVLRHTDTSPSGREWGWVCGLLEAGSPPQEVYERLLDAARKRRGHDAERYARRTLRSALQRAGRIAAVTTKE